MRALHVVGQLEYGGIASWLRSLVSQVNRDELAIDICCNYRGGRGELAPQFEQIGCRVFHIPLGANLRRYRRLLEQLIRTERYDVLHEHRGFLAGATLRAASRCDVSARIVYHHTPDDDRGMNPLKWVVRAFLKRETLVHATDIWGCSGAALAGQYGADWQGMDARMRVVHGCTTVAVPDSDHARAALRRLLGVDDGARVVGFVGRMAAAKNPVTALRIGLTLLDDDARAQLIFVGDGPLLAELRAIAARAPQAARVHFLGYRGDAVTLLAGMDLLLHPSYFEGLPLTIIEADQCGIPVVASNVAGTLAVLSPALASFTAQPDDVCAHIANARALLRARPVLRPASDRFADAGNFASRILADYRCALAR